MTRSVPPTSDKCVKPMPTWTKSLEWSNKISHLLTRVVRPRTAVGAQKVRIGGDGDGGYVLLDPGREGIAYSFGVSSYAPWDLEMAERGFTVHQYDGTVENGPYTHPNITFHRFNIGARPGAEVKTVGQILDDLGHRGRTDIILQMDIEDAEWDVFEALGPEEMGHFSQIIVECHGLDPRWGGFERRVSLLEKIKATHTPVHIHCNNVDPVIGLLPGLQPYSSFYELTYARTADYEFAECTDFFPTPLDRPNFRDRAEIFIGRPDLI